MALDPRKREKKLARKKAKQKAKQKNQRKLAAPTDMIARLQRCSNAPVLHSLATEVLWESGMGIVLLSRVLPNGEVAFSNFLVDRYCLGVKNAIYGIASRSRYDSRIYGDILEQGPVRRLEPAASRKLVEGAIRYAADLGFSPHRDYHKAKYIFADIDPQECSEEFEYGGEDGKPQFIAGPYDTPHRCQQIVRTLHDRQGPEGFHFFMPAAPGMSIEDLELIEDASED